MVGMAAGRVAEGKEQFYFFGEKTLGRNEPPSKNDFFEMGSITKTFTGLALAREILLGTVKLDTSVGELWPELAGTDAAKITLEQLATHSSGLPRMPSNFSPKNFLDPYADYTSESLLAYLKSFHFEKSGPYSYDYSNTGIGLLGLLLSEKLNHQSYENYLTQTVLKPLGLSDTRTQMNGVEASRWVQGYDSFLDPMPYWNLDALAGAGVLKITATDMMKYLRFNLESARHEGSAPDLLQDAARLAQTPRAALEEGVAGQIGLIWDVLENKVGQKKLIVHNGATGGYRALLAFAPEENKGFFSLVNTAFDPSCVGNVLLDDPCETKNWAAPPVEILEAYVGSYFSEEIQMSAEVFLKNGILVMRPQGQPQLRLWASTNERFSILEAHAEVEFLPPTTATKSLGFTLKQGRNFSFKRKD
jgi:CubicO group peptidase (beta-lactamase class C family)